MRKIKGFIAILATMAVLTGCDYFEVESKTLIDYRYSGEYLEWQTSDGESNTYHHNEAYELLWEYTYADGHKERKWEDCTRFEYKAAKEELGEVEP